MEEKHLHEEHHHEHEHEHHHEHEHEHEHHHEHAHEHEHHHEHDEHHHHHHGEECGCGHDHGHDHHHAHHHDHDHEHEHEHGHQYQIPGFRVFETHDHEGATICSFEKDVHKDPDTVITNMQNAIETLEKWLDAQDATIGHVKGYVREAGPVTTFSTVGYGLNVEKHDSNTVSAGFAAIVFGPEEEELKDQVAAIFASV